MTLALSGVASAKPLRQGSQKAHHGRLKTQPSRPPGSREISLDAVVGIDLGTSNSAIGIVDGSEARIVETGDGATTRSWVAFTEDKVLVGSEARRHSLDSPEDTFYSVKRLIGTPFDTASPDLQYAPFKAQAAEDGGTVLWCPARQAVYTPPEITSHIVRHLVSHVEGGLGSPVYDAVITVPAHFDELQRAATAEAGSIGGLKRARLLQGCSAEPVAAVIAYGLGKVTEDSLVLVVDLGGGTYDVSLVECFEGCLEVIATTGDAKLGGDDWDRVLMQWVLQQDQEDSAGCASVGDMQSLLRAVESAKQQLSECEQTRISIPSFEGGRGLHVPVTRADFEGATAPLLSRLWPPLEALGTQAHVAWAARPDEEGIKSTEGELRDHSGSTAPADRFSPQPRRVSRVALVGGATRMPSVQAFISRLTGIPVQTTIDPALCVALGATIYGGMLEGTIPGGVELADGAYSAALHDRHTGF